MSKTLAMAQKELTILLRDKGLIAALLLPMIFVIALGLIPMFFESQLDMLQLPTSMGSALTDDDLNTTRYNVGDDGAITIYCDRTNYASIIEAMLERDKLIEQLSGLQIDVVDSSSGDTIDVSLSALNLAAPILLMLLICDSAAYMVVDMFTGERERKTLGILILCAGARTTFFGKALVLCLLGLTESFFLTLSTSAYAYSSMLSAEYLPLVFLLLAALSLATMGTQALLAIILKSVRSAQLATSLVPALPVIASIAYAVTNASAIEQLPYIGLGATLVDVFSGADIRMEWLPALVSSMVMVVILAMLSLAALKRSCRDV